MEFPQCVWNIRSKRTLTSTCEHMQISLSRKTVISKMNRETKNVTNLCVTFHAKIHIGPSQRLTSNYLRLFALFFLKMLSGNCMHSWCLSCVLLTGNSCKDETRNDWFKYFCGWTHSWCEFCFAQQNKHLNLIAPFWNVCFVANIYNGNIWTEIVYVYFVASPLNIKAYVCWLPRAKTKVVD